ncbi:hypothetical protein [Gelidibacter salicanalis]|uniref:Uncharacterized protein n=1 Tax=Gelidibacter salicanalis TaxID=291193 RepID=A0A934NKU3_9FLAO|nr:hypothetical protein [Gelidibacter salicanalis]MBJ7882392.1 hypothetical protein [Gelidibacter salicanalis]
MNILSKTIILTLVAVNLSCKESPKNETTPLPTKIEDTTVSKIGEQCYLYAKNNDTIAVLWNENKTLVTGKIIFNFYEKDGSHGAFEGIMKGDTLYADYNFESEGTKSKREIIFLKKGNTLLQGYGDVEVDAHETTVFKKDAKITFDDQFPLTAVACDTLNF